MHREKWKVDVVATLSPVTYHRYIKILKNQQKIYGVFVQFDRNALRNGIR